MYKRIDKRIAKRYCIEGTHVVFAVPHKMNPESFWINGGVLLSDLVTDDINTFNKVCNSIEYYQCTSETGKYLAFYTFSD